MTQYDNTNRFTLFRNDRKETEKHADYSGTMNVDGREFWISAWLKEGAKGKFFSGSIKPKDSLAPKKPAPKKPAPVSDYASRDDDDPVPF